VNNKRLTQRELVFERLKAGETVKDIRDDFSSKSSIQAGIVLYLDWGEGKVSEIQGEIIELEAAITEMDSERKRLSEAIGEAEGKKDALDGETSRLRGEMSSLENMYLVKKREFDEWTVKLDSYLERGVTEDAISRIGKLDFGDSDELLERIATVEDHQRLLRNSKLLGDLYLKKLKEKQELDVILKKIKEEVDSETNSLDELFRRRRVHEEVYSVVQGFLGEGYDTDTLLSILEALRGLRVKGQPNTSIQRLVDGLNGFQRLSELEEACRKKESELTKVCDELLEAQATLKGIRFTVLKEIEDVKKRSIAKLEDQVSKAEGLSEDIRDKIRQDLNVLKEEQRANYEELSKLAVKNITTIHNEAVSEIQKASSRAQASLTKYENMIREWGREKEEQGKLGETLEYAKILENILVDASSAKNLPVYFLERVVHATYYWVNYNSPEAMIRPDQKTNQMERNLRTINDYKVLALLNLVHNYFSDLIYP